eukprot:3641338-Prymnesium_polylepis.1
MRHRHLGTAGPLELSGAHPFAVDCCGRHLARHLLWHDAARPRHLLWRQASGSRRHNPVGRRAIGVCSPRHRSTTVHR